MIDIGYNVLVNMGDTGIQLWLFCCVTIICNFVCLKQQNRLSLILAQRMSKYRKIIDNREPRTIFKATPIWNCRIELLQRSVARLRPLSLGQNALPRIIVIISASSRYSGGARDSMLPGHIARSITQSTRSRENREIPWASAG